MRVRAHNRQGSQREQRPAYKCQQHARARRAVGLSRFAQRVHPRHIGVDPYARANGQRADDELNGENHAQRRESRARILADEIAIHDVVQRLNQLGEHHRWRNAQQNAANALLAKIGFRKNDATLSHNWPPA